MNESIKQFEKWFKREVDPVKGSLNFENSVISTYFKCWQASRDAVVVQLPTTTEGFGMYSSEVAQHAIDLCAECIEEAGIKVKG